MLQLTPETVAIQKRLLENRFGENIWNLFSMLSWVRHLDIPGLIIHDERDAFVSAANGRQISRAWPNSELMLNSGLGHRRILTSPATLDALTGFLAPLASRRQNT